MYTANIAIELFIKGGPVMYPIILVCLVAVAVITERAIWWLRTTTRRQRVLVEDFFNALENDEVDTALANTKGATDPVAKVIREGLIHRNGAFHGALQSAASSELRAAARFLPTLDTIVTLGPLLGLLGTVIGIMASFTGMGDTELAINKVTGGISEALIATAFGLGIAIVTLIPYNWSLSKVTRLQQDIEFASNSLEVLLTSRNLIRSPSINPITEPSSSPNNRREPRTP